MAQTLTLEPQLRAARNLITIAAGGALSLTAYALGNAEGAAGVGRRFCMPGFARTGGDFARLGRRFGRQGEVFTPSYVERGRSWRRRDHHQYAGEGCAQGARDVVAALHFERTGRIGSSFGGLFTTSAAASRPSRPRRWC